MYNLCLAISLCWFGFCSFLIAMLLLVKIIVWNVWVSPLIKINWSNYLKIYNLFNSLLNNNYVQKINTLYGTIYKKIIYDI